ncbi:molecular chaperone GrpE [Knoellia remsis]|uniref:Protein GrpE n=1 Tax=Knoellia remsis TaxID=407159 RepID=A0A2T0UK15_9MICO|nr:nucleotide exchange factor GrpE [Knoellia remsis]PRY58270.1 molecular chaperone GrpE [Knoellia remsis]
MTDPRIPGDDEIVDAEVVEDGESADDAVNAINTESVNDGEEVAPGKGSGATAPAAGAAAGATSGGSGAATSGGTAAGGEHPDTALAAQRLDDLQRLNAEYVNYKRRVDRDRAAVQERAVRDVLETLLPVLDDIHAARQHGDLAGGPFAAIADKLETSLNRFGLTRFGEVGEPFDPMQHEALMHAAWDASNPALPSDATTTTVVQVLQPGYRTGEQVMRPARVAVADPE